MYITVCALPYTYACVRMHARIRIRLHLVLLMRENINGIQIPCEVAILKMKKKEHNFTIICAIIRKQNTDDLNSRSRKQFCKSQGVIDLWFASPKKLFQQIPVPYGAGLNWTMIRLDAGRE